MSGGVKAGPIARDGPNAERELAQYARACALAFIGRPPEAYRDWIAKGVGLANALVARDEHGEVMGGASLVPMGQFFGGRSVPMIGVAAVAVAPEWRGRGAAVAVMREAVREMRARGAAISVLYPALQELYRLVGFEQAGARYETAVPGRLINIRGREPGLRVRTVAGGDDPAIRAAYAAGAAPVDGHLDRGEYIWTRVRDFRGVKAEGFVIEAQGGAIEAYIFFSQRATDHPTLRHNLNVHDMAAATPRAARHLLGFLADHRSMTESIVWHGPAAGPLHALLPEQVYRVALHEHWMLRVIDAPAAFAARGYPPGLAAEAHLEIGEDPLVPENAGRWVLRVRDGRGSLERGGSGAVRVSLRGLAPLFTGHLSARSLRLAGHLQAEDADLAGLEAALRPTPGGVSMVDFF